MCIENISVDFFSMTIDLDDVKEINCSDHFLERPTEGRADQPDPFWGTREQHNPLCCSPNNTHIYVLWIVSAGRCDHSKSSNRNRLVKGT